uniref:Fibronectin type-III domain-containing protein n=1 Tax=Echinococcus canadensis TaxID=519352 RepID=A0A915F0M4_9CEST
MGSKTGNITVYGLPPSTDYQLILETVRPRRTPLHSTIYSTTGLDATCSTSPTIRLKIQEVAGHESSPQPVSFNKRPKYPIDRVCIIRTEEPSTSQCKAQQRSDERRNDVIRRNEEFAMHNSVHNQA